ncbi:MAG: TerC family protein [Acidobacteria bacterium]|nr:TerC family protein [Acidobacteriota bacterium]
MTEVTYFPFAEYWWFYAGFTTMIVTLLILDLGLFNRVAHHVSFREAATWVVVWVSLALVFCLGLHQYVLAKFGAEVAKELALEFLTGYVLEESLSVDNMFVFVVVFGYFGIPREHQHRVLFFGILGALIFRAIFIALGSALLQFQWTVWVFGAILIVTGLKMITGGSSSVDPSHNPAMKLLRRCVPLTKELKGSDFFVRIEGRLHATPLLACLMVLEMTDILFAVDSVPAIFAVTSEPLVVFTSNIFAILGLRSLYFLLAGAVHLFHLLKYGLSIVLVFVGLKMVWLNRLFDGHFPIVVSLAIITGVIVASIGLSLLFPRPPEPSEASPAPDADVA